MAIMTRIMVVASVRSLALLPTRALRPKALEAALRSMGLELGCSTLMIVIIEIIVRIIITIIAIMTIIVVVRGLGLELRAKDLGLKAWV